MNELLKLLKEDRAWSIEELAIQLNTDVEDVKRKIEFLENTGYLHRIAGCDGSCKGCTSTCTEHLKGLPLSWEVNSFK